MISKIRHLLPRILAKIFGRRTLERAESVAYDSRRNQDIVGFQFREKNKELIAKNYHEMVSLFDLIEEEDIESNKTMEVGAAYGRKSCWMSRKSDNHYAIEPSQSAYKSGKQYFPHLQWVNCSAQDLDLDQEFDFIFTWMVLQHIPQSQIEEAANRISTHLTDGGYLLITEETEGMNTDTYWPRKEEKYRKLFDDLNFIESSPRKVGPNNPGHGGKMMLFRKGE